MIIETIYELKCAKNISLTRGIGDQLGIIYILHTMGEIPGVRFVDKHEGIRGRDHAILA
jgi:hypothetical protein